MTDRFQASSKVTGVCYFDRGALSEERQRDLAAVHAIRSVGSAEPRFTFFVDEDAVVAAGALDAFSADRFWRIVHTVPADRPLVVDVSRAEYVDHRALLALDAVASASRPVQIRGAIPTLRKLPSLLGISTPHLRFE
jgi:hypothetical protein